VAKAWPSLAPRREQLDKDLARATDHNRTVFEAEAVSKRRDEAEAAAKVLEGQHAELTKVIEEIDRRKAAILSAAKLPVDGLVVTDDGVELAGVPFAQASGAERLRVALALAIAASPNLEDVWIRDGALLDEDHLELVAKHAAAAKKRVWIERVGTSDAGVIVIADGQVVS
jgi:ATPase subunit of ABC transporter with duplicated ATPase domains